MKKLNKSQRFILVMGILLATFGLVGKWSGWDIDYFPFFYTGSTLTWVAFLNTEKNCCWGIKRERTNSKP
ncbi:MAG: hypothetical protein AB3N18_05565 [Allomuricauda sp.]